MDTSPGILTTKFSYREPKKKKKKSKAADCEEFRAIC